MRCRGCNLFLTLTFVLVLMAPALIQVTFEGQRGERLQALEVFDGPPTPGRLQAYEQRLEDESVTIKTLRPWMLYAQYAWLRDPGSKVLMGETGWYFYRPGVEYVTERAGPQDKPSDPTPALCDFRDQLAARGIHLIVVPAPNKESVYPDKLTRRARGLQAVLADETSSLLDRLREADVDVVDLFELYADARDPAERGETGELYLRQDSHWSPAGILLAAQAVARRIQQRVSLTGSATDYETKSVRTERLGDVLEMLRVPRIEQQIVPEKISCQQVHRKDNGQPYADSQDSEVLVLGDSFLRIFAQDEPGSAGFVAHLAKELKQPIASIINDGGASTLVRQELYRRPASLSHKKVVVWEFAERDIRFGLDGWQIVPLPPVTDNAPVERRKY